jgi:hypothetical protein
MVTYPRGRLLALRGVNASDENVQIVAVTGDEILKKIGIFLIRYAHYEVEGICAYVSTHSHLYSVHK